MDNTHLICSFKPSIIQTYHRQQNATTCISSLFLATKQDSPTITGQNSHTIGLVTEETSGGQQNQ